MLSQMDPVSHPEESRSETASGPPSDSGVASRVHDSSAPSVAVPSAPAVPKELVPVPADSESEGNQEPSQSRTRTLQAPPEVTPTTTPGEQERRAPEQEPPATLVEAASIARCGRFDLIGRLAKGGMAEIFLARETVGEGLKRNVVVKVLRKSAQEKENDGRFEQLFLREGQVAAQLTHPNICHVYEFGRHLANYFIAMEYVEGASIRELCVRLSQVGEKLKPELAAWIFTQVAGALHYAHTARDARREPLGVVHRDVSPQNIMVRHDGVVKLLDFGVAHVAAAERDASAGLVFGKVAYMAPEQCRGEQNLDGRADVFSLGVCMYEALTGGRLYRRKDDRETLRAVLNEPPASILEVDPSLPPALDRIIMRALAKNREERFASADEMAQALDEYLAESGRVVNASSMSGVMRRLFAEQLKNGQDLSTEIDISDFRGSKPSVLLQGRSKLRPVSMRTARAQPVKRPRTLPLRALLVIAATVAFAAWLAMGSPDGPPPAKRVIAPAVQAGASAPQPESAEQQTLGDRQDQGPAQLPPGTASSDTNPAAEQEPAPEGTGKDPSPGFVNNPGF